RFSSCGNKIALAREGKNGGESLAEYRGEQARGEAHAPLPVFRSGPSRNVSLKSLHTSICHILNGDRRKPRCLKLCMVGRYIRELVRERNIVKPRQEPRVASEQHVAQDQRSSGL